MSEPQPNHNPNFKRFADWCLHKDSLSDEAKHTVEVLLKKAGTFDCYEAEGILTISTKLDLQFQDICDLNPLSSLTNLTYLDVFGNKISNLSPLSGLINLTFLEIRGMGNQISDLSPLSELTKLTELCLGNNQIYDLSSLSGLINLTKLYIGENAILDLNPLSRLINLTFLHLGKNHVSNVSPLSELINLTQLCLMSNQISDLSPLSGLTKLTALVLSSDEISDLSPISGLTNLTELYIHNISISDLGLLFGLTKLNTLSISRQTTFDLSWLSFLWGKWIDIVNVPIDTEKTTESLTSIYAVIGLEKPEVIFFSSPQAGIQWLLERQSLRELIGDKILKSTVKRINPAIWSFLRKPIENNFPEAEKEIWTLLEWELEDILSFSSDYYITPEDLFETIGITELLIRELNYKLDQEEQEALKCLNQLFENCGWILPFEKVCVVCDRPRKISLDSENHLHAEAEPAIQFADGWHTGYYYHGVRIPEKYGKLHYQQWQSQWLLEENNAEIRRVLIQVIGYDRICQELQAQELDSWREYTLLCMDTDVDIEPIYLLKMTCPSTGKIHALRVPPEIKSAREAIRWVNWEIDSEDFSIET